MKETQDNLRREVQKTELLSNALDFYRGNDYLPKSKEEEILFTELQNDLYKLY